MAQSPKPSTEVKPKYTFGATYIFRFRRHEGDHFSGLWDLDLLDEKGIEKARILKVIGQADNLSDNLVNLQGQLEDDGL